MTDDRTPETPGLAEVSPKFVDEAEAATTALPSSASVPDDPLLSLRAERQQVEAEIVAKLDADGNEREALSQSIKDVETRIIEALPQTLLGALAQLEVLASMADEGVPGFAMGVIADMNKQIPARIERLLAAPGDAVVVLRQRWENVMVERGQLKNRDDENPKHPDVIEDERLHDVQLDIEDSIADTPTHTAAGVVAKLLQLRRNETEFDGDAPWRPAAFRTALDALGRGTMPTTTVAETPPAEDAALFDALAEYDRLTAISQDLEHRKEVFRPGIPEAKEADEAFEAAYNETMVAWTRARDIRATTQAGLFAKLQATVRFMADLEQDELYEAEWQAIKADVQRIAGKGTAKKRQTVPIATAASGASDPVAQIGRDLAAVWRQVWRNDDEKVSVEAHSPESTRLERLGSHLADRREALEAMAAEVQAGALEGVMVQIMLAHAEADVMAASTEENNEAQMRTIGKLLYSALAALERLAGVPREKLGGEAYLTRELDPHALVAGDEIEGTA